MEVKSVDTYGAFVLHDSQETFVSWEQLRAFEVARDASEIQRADIYQQIRRGADEMVCVLPPVEIGPGERPGSNTYCVAGRGVDGQWRPIRAYRHTLQLRADEGMTLYRSSHVREEARQIAERNGTRESFVMVAIG